MTQFRYRAIGRDGQPRQGTVEANDQALAAASLRRGGSTVVELFPMRADAVKPVKRATGKSNAAVAAFVAESAVLIRAGLPLDRALGLAIDNIEPRKLALHFAPILAEVREGRPLSRVLADHPDLFAPEAVAMCEAGEANGRLPEALERLADMIERATELRKTVVQASIYPASLFIIAVGVILIMLLFVVPQFESVLGSSKGHLPASSLFVLGASRTLREDWLYIAAGIAGGVFVVRQLFSSNASRVGMARFMLGVPQIGDLIRRIEAARFARTLGALVDGEVALPHAISLAQRTLSNPVMAEGIAGAAAKVRQGASLSASLASAAVLPQIAMGFVRTGEESSELGQMLLRLADVLDRDIKARLARIVAIATPLITVILGASVAGIVASIMTAIMGFNELAVS